MQDVAPDHSIWAVKHVLLSKVGVERLYSALANWAFYFGYSENAWILKIDNLFFVADCIDALSASSATTENYWFKSSYFNVFVAEMFVGYATFLDFGLVFWRLQ